MEKIIHYTAEGLRDPNVELCGTVVSVEKSLSGIQ